MTSEGEHLPGMDRAAIALAALLKGSDLRNRLAEGGRNGIKSLARSFAHEFQTSTYFEFLKERRDVEFDGAFGEVEFVGNFLVGRLRRIPSRTSSSRRVRRTALLALWPASSNL